MLKEGFLWGGAISAIQAEGAYREGGRGETMLDYATAASRTKPRMITFTDKDGNASEFEKKDGELPAGGTYREEKGTYYPNRIGIDFYHHYKEDIALLAGMGFKMFRLSISWPRIYPNGDDEQANKAGIAFYRSVFVELHKYGIEPLVTLNHQDTPAALEQKYHWHEREMISIYVRYAVTCLQAFKGLVRYWIPFNQINGAARCLMDEKASDETVQKKLQELHHKFLASAMTVKEAHRIDPENKVGCMLAATCCYPGTCDPEDILKNRHHWEEAVFYCGDVLCRGRYGIFSERIWHEHHTHIAMQNGDAEILAEGTADLFSFSYYSSSLITTHKGGDTVGGDLIAGQKNPYLQYSDWGWSYDATGLRYYLVTMYERYGLPMLIAENGLGAEDHPDADQQISDDYRISYLKEHFQEMIKAAGEGVDIIGYLMWAPLDLVSSSTGEMKKRYGVIYVDLDDQGNGSLKRFKKKSYDWYQRVIASNGADLE